MIGATDITGRTALVTGAGRGIGLEIARQLAQNGARLIAHEADWTAAEAARHLLPEAIWVVQDFIDPEAGNELTRAWRAHVQRIDILVLNAAMQERTPPLQITGAGFQRQMDVNLRVCVGLLQGVLPGMAANRWGRLITIGSIQERRPNPELAVYAASKSALKTLALALVRPHFAKGITTNHIAPGLIDTERNADLKADIASYEAIIDRIPARCAGTARDIALATAFLCSDAGRYIIGADLPIDGGAHIPV